MGYISWCHHWFHSKMMYVKRVQKFRTDDMSIPRSGSAFWLVEANFQPIRPTTQIWGMKGHQYGIFCPHFPDIISQGNQLWPGEMSAVFSGCYKKGWKWLHEYIFNSLYNLHPPLYSGTLPYGYLSNTVTSLLWPLFWRGLYISLHKKPH